ncbi:MAG: ion transporter [Thermodesulfobacteriota bacterium]
MAPLGDNWQAAPWRLRLHEIIFEADTRGGKAFDLCLIASIVMSVLAVMLDSVAAVHIPYARQLFLLEWFFTLLFTVEYLLRLVSTKAPWRYARSFFGLVDLLAIIPTYISLFLPGGKYLLVIRILRILRVFRVLKLVWYLKEAHLLLVALGASRRKITVFLFVVLTLVVVFGSFMYVIEGDQNGFTSIPRSIYWAIVTMTTVGYGDISPQTNLGQSVASLIMIIGYAILAVPTGIVTVEMANAWSQDKLSCQVCRYCNREGHDSDATYCKFCGGGLKESGEGDEQG